MPLIYDGSIQQHPANRRTQLLAVQLTLIILATIVVALRLFTRLCVLKKPWWDDLAITVALITAIGETSLILTCLNHGVGLKNQSIADQTYTLEVFYVARILYSVAIASIKFSILLLYLRLFPSLWVRRGVRAVMAICTIGCTVLLFLWVMKCKPIPKSWNLHEPGTCVHKGSLFQAHTIFSLLTNVMIILLPMQTLWSLHMPLRRRILVMSIFGIGLIPCIALIVRLGIFTQTSAFDSDPTWWITKTENWVLAEYSTGLICASLIHLKPLVKMLIPSLFIDTYQNPTDVERALPQFREREFSLHSRQMGRKYGYFSRSWITNSSKSKGSGGTVEVDGMVKITTQVEFEDKGCRPLSPPEKALTWPPHHCDKAQMTLLRNSSPV